ncbi:MULTISPECIES: alpha/beta hydrolase [unclassified Pseudomonas]|uniref:alpha/beta hydrolase n=1 Tax=unclassified Pseudomonas TaxID=196821 RepID=UPI00132007E6|nr:alpha/beta fold hydrolase [Pseudomonas sp. R84]QHC95087.1 alpha/beta hydrolase [Pseudomonas sp. R84]
MFQSFMTRLRRRRLAFACMAALIIGVPASCGVLQHTERKLLFRIEPGTAGWYHGLPGSVQELDLQPKSFKAGQNIHAWWWPAEKASAPAILYLHGVRWNLTGQLFRIEQLRAAGYSVLAIDYRGFGKSHGDLPSESSVYEDARVAWERFKLLQPDPAKRLIYGHSLGGAVAIDLAAELGQTAARDHSALPVRGLVIESTFTTLADVAASVANTSLPVRWLLSQKFDSIDKIADIHMPLLVVHGLADAFVPPRFSEQLFNAAQQPKRLLLVPGATHNNSMALGGQNYRKALDSLMQSKPVPRVAGPTTVRSGRDT